MKIVLEKHQNLYFTSDTHYGHHNICRATTNWKDADDKTRDFPSLDVMNDVLVNRINETVGEDDILIHIGDWSFGGFDNIAKFRNRLLVKNIYLFLGNHDHHIRRNRDGIQGYFTKVLSYDVVNIRRPHIDGHGKMEKYQFAIMHYPIASWDGLNSGVPHLHGHVHLPPHLKVADGRAMDVGVDGNNLYPYSLDEVLDIVSNRPIKKLTLPADHHEKEI